MDEIAAISALGALAQPTRMRIVTSLAGARPGGLAVGDLAKLVDVPQNTMSNHLAILSRAGLVTANRLGRVVEYSLCANTLDELAAFVAGMAGAGSIGPR